MKIQFSLFNVISKLQIMSFFALRETPSRKLRRFCDRSRYELFTNIMIRSGCTLRNILLDRVLVYLKSFFSTTFTHRHCRIIEFLHVTHTHKHIPDAAVVVKSLSFFPNRKSFGYDFRFFSFVVYSVSLKECFEKKKNPISL